MTYRVAFVHQAFEFLGVEAVAASLQRAGFEVGLAFDPRLFDDTYMDHPRLGRWFAQTQATVEKAVALDADVYLFSVVSPAQRWARAVVSALKEARPEAITVFGGIHPSAVPERVLEDPAVDYVIVGEGDEACVDLVRALERGEREPDVANVCFRRGDDLVQNPVRPFIEDLDTLPFPAKELFYNESPLFKYGYTIQSGRGCHLRCTFCYNSFFASLPASSSSRQRYVRRRSVENVVEELRIAKQRHGARVVRFFDDNFVYDEEWMDAFADRYSREVGLPFWCLGNPDKLTPRTVKALEKAGCYELQMGVQTASEKTRRGLLARSETNQDVARAIDLLAGTRIRSSTDNILNLPNQTEEDLTDLAHFYNRHRPGRINVYWLTYFAGSKILDTAMKEGWLDRDHGDSLKSDPPAVAIHVNARRDGPRLMRRFQTYLSLSLFLPRRVNDWILARRLYRFFPVVDPFLVTGIAFNLRDFGAPPSLFQKRFFDRYRTYGMARVARALGLGRPPARRVGAVLEPADPPAPAAAPATAVARSASVA